MPPAPCVNIALMDTRIPVLQSRQLCLQLVGAASQERLSPPITCMICSWPMEIQGMWSQSVPNSNNFWQSIYWFMDLVFIVIVLWVRSGGEIIVEWIQIVFPVEIIFFLGKNSWSENGEKAFQGKISGDDHKLLVWQWKIWTGKHCYRMDKENLSSEGQNLMEIPGLAIAMDPKGNSCLNSTQPNFKTGCFKSGSETTVFDSHKCREPQPNISNAPANVDSPTKNIV